MKQNAWTRQGTESFSKTDIDLNALFNLNYNFDLLKGIIEQLLKNQNALQNQIDELYGNNGEKDKRIEQLEKEVKIIKETYVNKSQLKEIENDLKEIKERLKKHDIQIEDSKKYLIKFILKIQF